jgi:hypothetical protein
MPRKSMKTGVFRPQKAFQPVWDFFRLAERLRLPTMRSHKSSAFLANDTHLQSRGFQGRRPRMTQFDGELSPPFEIVEPAAWRAPIIFNSPHSGSVYPHEFLTASRIDLPRCAAPKIRSWTS